MWRKFEFSLNNFLINLNRLISIKWRKTLSVKRRKNILSDRFVFCLLLPFHKLEFLTPNNQHFYYNHVKEWFRVRYTRERKRGNWNHCYSWSNTSGVPHKVYVRSRTTFAKPKSVIFKYPSAAKRMFSGFKSR